jgi:RNA polymerase sigma-70 factor (ECF subfamily)
LPINPALMLPGLFPCYTTLQKGEGIMAALMILPISTTQEDLTELVFSDLLRSFLQQHNASTGNDLSRPSDRTTCTTASTTNQPLRQEGNTSEPAELSEDQTQKPTGEIGKREKYELQERASQGATDATLVELAAAGNEQAFERLVQRYEKQVSQFVYRHVVYTEEVQDIVQFVFLQLYLFLPRLRGHLVSTRSQRPLKAWLLQVAKNRCHDEHRKKHPCLFSEFEAEIEEEISPLEYLPDPAPLPEEYVEEWDQRRQLQAAIQTLPSHFRSIVSLRYQEELSFREIGHRLNIPENTAKTYYQRARPLLRKALANLSF